MHHRERAQPHCVIGEGQDRLGMVQLRTSAATRKAFNLFEHPNPCPSELIGADAFVSEAFANSPPWFMCKSQTSRGGKRPYSNNLPSAQARRQRRGGGAAPDLEAARARAAGAGCAIPLPRPPPSAAACLT